MTTGATATFQVEFRRSGRPQASSCTPLRMPRVARLLARVTHQTNVLSLAPSIEEQILGM